MALSKSQSGSIPSSEAAPLQHGYLTTQTRRSDLCLKTSWIPQEKPTGTKSWAHWVLFILMSCSNHGRCCRSCSEWCHQSNLLVGVCRLPWAVSLVPCSSDQASLLTSGASPPSHRQDSCWQAWCVTNYANQRCSVITQCVAHTTPAMLNVSKVKCLQAALQVPGQNYWGEEGETPPGVSLFSATFKGSAGWCHGLPCTKARSEKSGMCRKNFKWWVLLAVVTMAWLAEQLRACCETGLGAWLESSTARASGVGCLLRASRGSHWDILPWDSSGLWKCFSWP